MSVTDQEIFDQATGEQIENTPETPPEAPTEAKPERARDDKGKFVKATPDATSQEAPVAPTEESQPEAEKEDARIPSWRLKEESDRRREAEQALNELRNEFRQMQMQMMQARQPPQPQPETPDIFADPQGFIQSLQANFDNRLKTLQLENSLRFAHQAHGDKFNKAYDAFTNYVAQSRDQASYQRVMASHDPGEALVQWYREQELQQQLGGSDLQSFIEKQKEEWLKDPTVQAKVIEAFKATQQSQPSNPVHLPPSLSRAAAARSSHDEGGTSGADMYSYATAKR